MKNLTLLLTLLLFLTAMLSAQVDEKSPAPTLTALDDRTNTTVGPAGGTEPQATQDTLRKGKETPPPDFVEVEKEPVLKKKTDPRYPEVAKKAGIEGKVWVKLWVNTEGKVQAAQILKSENDILNEAALECARQWEFEPATVKGKPVSVWVSVPFMFKLSDKKSPEQESGKYQSESGMYQAMTGTVMSILAGKRLDNPGMAVDSAAIFVNGSQSLKLLPALEMMGQKNGFPNEGERSATMLHQFKAGGTPNLFAIVVRTQKKKGEALHFHTVIWQKPSAGYWKIVHWHTSR